MNQARLHFELVGATRRQQTMMNKLDKLIMDATMEDLAPLMVACVARMLVLGAENDPIRLGWLVTKFTHSLALAVDDMASDQGVGEPRQ